jgi:PPOX class probable F420-dependent enzyme
MQPDVLAEFLQQPYIGVLATLRRDGRPYTVPIWWLWHQEAFWISGTYPRVWCKQLLADPRSSLCIETTDPVARHVEVDGICESFHLPAFDIWPVSALLAKKYVGRGDPKNDAAIDRFLKNMKTEPRLLFRLVPEVWRAIDLTVYRGKRADRQFQAKADEA